MLTKRRSSCKRSFKKFFGVRGTCACSLRRQVLTSTDPLISLDFDLEGSLRKLGFLATMRRFEVRYNDCVARHEGFREFVMRWESASLKSVLEHFRGNLQKELAAWRTEALSLQESISALQQDLDGDDETS